MLASIIRFGARPPAGEVATTVKDGEEVEASGGTAGMEFGAALLLGLDFLDPATAKRAVASRGMVGSYLVLSYTFLQPTDLAKLTSFTSQATRSSLVSPLTFYDLPSKGL